MKSSRKIKAVLLLSAFLLSLLSAAFAVSAYDGTSDPIISLSYLEQYKTQQIDPQIKSLQSEITALENVVNQLLANGSAPDTDSDTGANKYTVLELHSGQKLMCGESCELILRAGTATVVLGANSLGGISDLTGAKDLANGEAITANHLLLVPRSDGRGMLVTSDTAFIMVRGDYTVE